LGSHVADELSRRGIRTTVYDRTVSRWLRDDQEMVVGDVSDLEALRAVLHGAAYVYHMAGIADIGEARNNPLDVVRDNVIGSANVIEACLAAGVARLVFASTVYVYSDQGSFYRVSKQAVEALLETYSKEFGLQYTSLRYGSLYGPRSQPWNGLKRFVSEAVRNGRIDYPGNGDERREFIHVKDAAKLSVDILDQEYVNQCVNLTGAQILSSRELMALISEILGGGVEISFTDVRAVNHYGLTPYRYTPKQARKMVPVSFYDIGQGVLELIEEESIKAGE